MNQDWLHPQILVNVQAIEVNLNSLINISILLILIKLVIISDLKGTK